MILENLVRLSFEQESIIESTGKLIRNDPKLQDLIVRQKDFTGKMKVIEDSLNAIGKRQLEIKPVVTKELTAINSNIEMALEQYGLKNFSNVITRQQFAMTSINNLALLLNESLQRMNEKMSNSMQSKSGNKSCNNPSSGKKGKKSAKDLKDLQGKIGEQLKKLKEGMEGAKKDGKTGKPDLKGMNKELAKLAAQQEALRNEMQKYQNELGEKGVKNNSGLNDAAKEMEQIEKDLVNKKITQETIKRQQSILTRLLESEKAEQEREKEERRESTEAKTQKKSNLPKNFEYKSNTRGSYDQLKLELPGLQGFYKNKVNSYFVKIER
jgi:chromosome segregation ATPase